MVDDGDDDRGDDGRDVRENDQSDRVACAPASRCGRDDGEWCDAPTFDAPSFWKMCNGQVTTEDELRIARKRCFRGWDGDPHHWI